MKIYVAHSRYFDFQQQLYQPIKNSRLAQEHTLVFPHSENNKPFNSKQLFQEDCDLVLAEITHPSTGLGIELGWANIYEIPIVFVYKKGTKVSASFRAVSDTFFEYEEPSDLVGQVEGFVQEMLGK